MRTWSAIVPGFLALLTPDPDHAPASGRYTARALAAEVS